MTTRIISHVSSAANLIVGQTATKDGAIYSLIFENAKVDSGLEDSTDQPEHLSFDLTLKFEDAIGAKVQLEVALGWIAVEPQDWAVCVMRANGVRAVYQNSDQANSYEAIQTIVNENNEISISIGLWAQRNPSQKTSSAGVILDTLDVRLL